MSSVGETGRSLANAPRRAQETAERVIGNVRGALNNTALGQFLVTVLGQVQGLDGWSKIKSDVLKGVEEILRRQGPENEEAYAEAQRYVVNQRVHWQREGMRGHVPGASHRQVTDWFAQLENRIAAARRVFASRPSPGTSGSAQSRSSQRASGSSHNRSRSSARQTTDTSDPYKTLGIKRGASTEEIKAAFRARVKESHPDLHPNDPAAATRFRNVVNAYQKITGTAPMNIAFIVLAVAQAVQDALNARRSTRH
jgi:hypothetical protein